MKSTFLVSLLVLVSTSLCQLTTGSHDIAIERRAAFSEQSPIQAMGGTRGFRNVVYYVNWAIYGRQHTPSQMPAKLLTHVLYSFANVSTATGEVQLTDPWADTDKHLDNEGWNDPGTLVYGCVKQLFKLKQQNRNLKVLLSIGGWTYSSNFPQMASTADGRQKFATSAVKILEDAGFDGIDIDWEYPSDSAQAKDFVELLRVVREELTKAEQKRKTKVHFLLTVASPAGKSNYEKLQMKEMDQYLDFWNLMAYDYAGSWDKTAAGHQANWFSGGPGNKATPFSTDAALKYYFGQGVAQDKVVVGMPLYGRAFTGSQGPGTPFTDVGEGSWEKGVWDYKVLPKSACEVHNDDKLLASWCMDPSTGTMISYDTPEIVKLKSEKIFHYGLGGAMWWESSSDKPLGQGSLIETFVNGCGGETRLEQQQNCLEYPDSKYDNIKKPS